MTINVNVMEIMETVKTVDDTPIQHTGFLTNPKHLSQVLMNAEKTARVHKVNKGRFRPTRLVMGSM